MREFGSGECDSIADCEYVQHIFDSHKLVDLQEIVLIYCAERPEHLMAPKWGHEHQKVVFDRMAFARTQLGRSYFRNWDVIKNIYAVFGERLFELCTEMSSAERRFERF